VVVVVGDNVTAGVNKPPGFQVYVDPPDAVRKMELPIQIEAVDGVMVMLGTGLTTRFMV